MAFGKFVAGFANEDDFFDLWGLENFVDFGQVFVIGFVAAAENEDNVLIWKGFDGNTSRRWVSGKIVIVVFYAI